MRLRNLFLLFSIVLFLVAGCQGNVIERQEVSIPGTEWQYLDTLKFAFELADTNARYDLVAEVDHLDDYPYQNLYTRISTVSPQADTTVQVISLELAEHTGQWYGQCAGHTCTVEIFLRQNFRVRQSGVYEIWIEQFMRDPGIPGIRGISLVLLSAGKK